jgi:SAM-dependent methyltransferase
VDIYKNILYSKAPGEEKIIYEGREYYRYMDKMYIPSLPSELSVVDVSALSEIRIKLKDEVIDYSYTKELISQIIKKTPENKRNKILDFGCGGGILSEVLQEKNEYDIKSIVGVDLCEFAVKTSINIFKNATDVEYTACFFDGSERLPLEDNSIDSVISTFVMHFPIYENQLEELYRVMSHGACFVYNDYIYNKYPAHMKKIIARLKKVGFSITEDVAAFKHPDTHDIKMHKVVVAMK